MILIRDDEFRKLSAYIKKEYGINLKDEKRTLVSGRLQNVLVQSGLTNFSDYFDYVVNDKTGVAAGIMINKISTNHTFFMREEDHFYYLRDHILPHLAHTIKDRDLRIWSAGCSSGEEAYTLAMLIDDYFGADQLLWDTKILATDISTEVLTSAQKGIYSVDRLQNVPNQWKMKYFRSNGNDKVEVSEGLKNEIVFRKFNLMEEVFPFKKKFHVIFCRNVMIYFDNQTRYKLVNQFYNQLENGGYLFVGHSESIVRDGTKFKYIRPAVYRKME